MIGINNFYSVAADVVITSNATLATVGLTSPIAAGQTQKLRLWLPITVGATGGVKIQAVVPGSGTSFHASILLANTVAPSLTPAAQNSSASFGNALANAGTHWIWADIVVVNGATAGNVDIQVAQNSSDSNSLTVLRGASLEVIKY